MHIMCISSVGKLRIETSNVVFVGVRRISKITMTANERSSMGCEMVRNFVRSKFVVM